MKRSCWTAALALIHPSLVAAAASVVQVMEEGVQLGKVVAVGECGLGALRQGGGKGGHTP